MIKRIICISLLASIFIISTGCKSDKVDINSKISIIDTADTADIESVVSEEVNSIDQISKESVSNVISNTKQLSKDAKHTDNIKIDIFENETGSYLFPELKGYDDIEGLEFVDTRQVFDSAFYSGEIKHISDYKIVDESLTLDIIYQKICDANKDNPNIYFNDEFHDIYNINENGYAVKFEIFDGSAGNDQDAAHIIMSFSVENIDKAISELEYISDFNTEDLKYKNHTKSDLIGEWTAYDKYNVKVKDENSDKYITSHEDNFKDTVKLIIYDDYTFELIENNNVSTGSIISDSSIDRQQFRLTFNNKEESAVLSIIGPNLITNYVKDDIPYIYGDGYIFN